VEETGPIDAAELDTALQALLRTNPGAWVAAIDDRGFFVAVPPTLDVGSHELLPARSALDLVELGERAGVVATWNRAQTTGAARTGVHLKGTGTEGQLHFFDLRPRYGVYVGVLVAEAGHELTRVREAVSFRPRLCIQRKNEVAVWTEVDDDTSRMLGWERSALVGRRGLELVHPDDQDRAIEAWMDMLARPDMEHRVRVRYLTLSGDWLWVETVHRNHLDDPELGYVIAECLDVSDEMAAHEAVREREQLLQRIAETVPLGLLQLDGEGRAVYANERLASVLGGSGSSAEDHFADVADDDRTALDDALRSLFANGCDRDLEIEVRSERRHDRRFCHVRLRALTQDNGAVNGAILCFEDVTERVHSRAELEHRATRDGLTGCLNRSSIMSVLQAAVAGATGVGVGVGVAFIDLDGFKDVNDTRGHAAGDEVLIEIARRLRSHIRTDDTVGRLGGDEFLVVCPGIDHRDELPQLARRLCDALRAPIPLASGALELRASIGVASTRDVGRNADALVAMADSTMYEVKRGHRGSAA
jgi:diguanylate cyclase (GGDEF)-like protein/PAS domain S-box-containing protein